MKVWAICAQKGGVGKTTLAQCLAVENLKEGARTAIVDLDPQRSCHKWGTARAKRGIPVPAVVALDGRRLQEVIADLNKQGAAVVIVDSPARASGWSIMPNATGPDCGSAPRSLKAPPISW